MRRLLITSILHPTTRIQVICQDHLIITSPSNEMFQLNTNTWEWLHVKFDNLKVVAPRLGHSFTLIESTVFVFGGKFKSHFVFGGKFKSHFVFGGKFKSHFVFGGKFKSHFVFGGKFKSHFVFGGKFKSHFMENVLLI